jgi:hypothetical protein
MRAPEMLLIPALMLLDHTLTVYCAVLRQKKYSDHFALEHYELNPMWQKDIARARWINPRHIAVTVLVTAGLVALTELTTAPQLFVDFILGALLTAFTAIIGRHLSNLLTFQRLDRYPHELSGRVTLSHSFILYISTVQLLVLVIPLLGIAVFSPSSFVIGAVVGAAALLIAHVGWLRRYMRQNSAHNLETPTN